MGVNKSSLWYLYSHYCSTTTSIPVSIHFIKTAPPQTCNTSAWDPTTGSCLHQWKGNSSVPRRLVFTIAILIRYHWLIILDHQPFYAQCLLFNIIKVFPSVCLIGQDYLVSGQPNKPLLNVWQVQPKQSQDIPHQANLQVNRSEQIPLRLFTPGPVSSLATSPSGSYLAAAVQESITIWQIGTGGPAVQFCANIFTLSYQGPCWLCCPGTTSLWLSSPSPKTEVILSVEERMDRFWSSHILSW